MWSSPPPSPPSPCPATVAWPAGVQWVKADVGETGVYRVNYDTENWRALIQHLMDNPDSTVSEHKGQL